MTKLVPLETLRQMQLAADLAIKHRRGVDDMAEINVGALHSILGELQGHRDALAESEAGRHNWTLLECVGQVKAVVDILAERERQKSVEGWTVEHDDTHEDGSLAQAAACYAIPWYNPIIARAKLWPASWALDWWKPATTDDGRRRELVKAGALILAEIERLDRATPTGASPNA